jgi:uncharacterized protein (DUF305 family)
MIAHHESAMEMAEVAFGESENFAIRKIAQDIVSTQRREIPQMKERRRD